MKLLNLLTLGTLCLGAVACQQDIPDGKIPSEYQEKAKQYEGQYEGVVKLMRYRMNGGRVSSARKLDEISNARLTLTLNGGRPGIHSDFDFTMKDECQSSIGDIKSVSVSPVINDVATFKFNRGNCQNEFKYEEITFWVGKGLNNNEHLLFEIVKYHQKDGAPQRYIDEVVKGRFTKI